MKIITPEKFGGKTYIFKDFIPNHLFNDLMKTRAEIKEDILFTLNIKEHLLIELSIEPKLTPTFLDSEDCNGAEMLYLLNEILSKMFMTEERVGELEEKPIKA